MSDFCTLYPGVTFSLDTQLLLGGPDTWPDNTMEDMLLIARLNRLRKEKCDGRNE